jgi:AbrB family looped-hinge helix DNA binding protein
MEEIQVARVTSKGQMTIPRSAREQAGIKPGDLVVVRVVDGMVVIAKAELRSPLRADDVLAGLARGLA